ncbi:MAG: hypothetical protein OXG44_19355 [Gammaproteobacteria bacterium]|nr:hypothetical protein [Gammaproteobacteria bacterium]
MTAPTLSASALRRELQEAKQTRDMLARTGECTAVWDAVIHECLIQLQLLDPTKDCPRCGIYRITTDRTHVLALRHGLTRGLDL